MDSLRALAIAEGRKTYFTGNACPHGHIAERRTRDGFCIECSKIYQKTYSKIYYKDYQRKDDRYQYFVEYDRNRDPQKKSARKELNKALNKGLINKSVCFKCGTSNAEAHHPDYRNPLDVIWLCRIHHAEIHHPLI